MPHYVRGVTEESISVANDAMVKRLLTRSKKCANYLSMPANDNYSARGSLKYDNN